MKAHYGTFGLNRGVKSKLEAIIGGHIIPESPLLDPQFWLELNTSGGLRCDGMARSEKAGELTEAWKEAGSSLRSLGYFQIPDRMEASLCSRLLSAMSELEASGYPAAFIWMYDEPWLYLSSIWEGMASLVGGEAVLEPSVFAYSLQQPRNGDKKGGKVGSNDDYVGRNFGLPHRDYTYEESFHPNRQESTLTFWCPLTASTYNNGCLYVLPKEFDPEFETSGSMRHMRVATETPEGTTELAFNLPGVRPLIVEEGASLAWTGNLIHWGSQCASGHE